MYAYGLQWRPLPVLSSTNIQTIPNLFINSHSKPTSEEHRIWRKLYTEMNKTQYKLDRFIAAHSWNYVQKNVQNFTTINKLLSPCCKPILQREIRLSVGNGLLFQSIWLYILFRFPLTATVIIPHFPSENSCGEWSSPCQKWAERKPGFVPSLICFITFGLSTELEII